MGVGPRTRLANVVGARTADAFERSFDVTTVGDLLRHYPRRLAERGSLTDLAALRVDEHVTVLARVVHVKEYPFRPKGGGRPGGKNVRSEVVVTDGTGELVLTFFRQPWIAQRLRPGTLGMFAGKVGEFRGRKQLLHPEIRPTGSEEEARDEAEEYAGTIVPIYPATQAVSSWTIEKTVAIVLDALDEVDDPVPEPVRRRRGLVDLRTAYEDVHRPRELEDYQRARERLKYEEAFVLQTTLAVRRHALSSAPATRRPHVADGLRDRFEAQLPFALTAGQQEVAAQIEADLDRDQPMQRLLQGEVGSGKTVVALLAMLQVVDTGGQAVLLAPTEVLAQQHHRSMVEMLGPMAQAGMLGSADAATRVRLLTGSMGQKARREALLDAASGEAGILVGTHALLEDKVQLAELGLVVVDEQHRFGVEQRAALTAKGVDAPHLLVMTATPIPRTVAMTVFGDLDTSTLTELPRGRQPIQTTVVPVAERPAWVDRTWERLREEVADGRQAYVVCPRIGDGGDRADASEDGAELEPAEDESARPLTSVLALHELLRDGPLAGLRTAALHGRMAAEDKEAVMRAFAAGEIDVLVATTVIEVGVDVPNATAMVIMDADRFGVSQLHQLRGRVGRGAHAGLCLLVTGAPVGSAARERLDAVAATSDGFALSRLDVEMRREGDVLGARQSGVRSSLRLLSVVRDEQVISDAREDAAEVVADDPSLAAHAALAAVVRELEDSTQADYLEKT
ncbi:ATP-dependent DNA helicase RecG [Mumia sp. zg.B17]|uniref:ATP-dependent DNA helicase RecG n=1 Tax=Mumia sp. zg.B17 TaxID=2855446 RepID=UPI001C6E1043|nr:ATP-dependent DNA helicase RecG [Mumia sp. zg.B17]MBW9206399.1 ATP-dependent DNA helicase RecG [Mumia sp. zg.B17]